DGLKVQNGLGKHLLRLWLSRHLPEAEPFSKKRGFTVPVGEWIAKRGAALGEAVARQAGIAELCQPDAVRALYRSDLASDGRRGFAAWTLLFYALWHRRHIEGREAEGDVAHMLH
ncbi:MAG: asparagine synthetase B, partial [Alphaproteobacteria bacterium]|nr:asparagine synthetase B [Alphaproteobacteria bacterium]